MPDPTSTMYAKLEEFTRLNSVAASVSGRVVSIPVSFISDAFATLLVLLGFVGIAAGIVLEVSFLTILGALSFIV